MTNYVPEAPTLFHDAYGRICNRVGCIYSLQQPCSMTVVRLRVSLTLRPWPCGSGAGSCLCSRMNSCGNSPATH